MKSYLLPISIVLVGVLAAGSIFLLSRGGTTPLGGTALVRAVDASDHILGNPEAPVIVIEYSDLECPYCKDFHETMAQVMNYYGKSGKVAWVFRNFPIPQLHSKAPKEAEAAECAAAQGGNEAFFTYINKVFAITPSNNGLNLASLPQIAEEMGLDRQIFEQCLSSGIYTQKVSQAYTQAVAEGAQGTPHTVIMARGENILTLSGNQPYASMRAAIDEVLRAIGESIDIATTSSSS